MQKRSKQAPNTIPGVFFQFRFMLESESAELWGLN
jgi:hypothetical protein